MEKSMKSMAPAGRLVNCGVTSGEKAEIDIRYVFVKQFSLMGSFMGRARRTSQVLSFFEDGNSTRNRLSLPTHGSCEGSGEDGEKRTLWKDRSQSRLESKIVSD